MIASRFKVAPAGSNAHLPFASEADFGSLFARELPQKFVRVCDDTEARKMPTV
jgi:hypothetical protein